MQTLQRKQVIGFTFAASLMVILLIATFASGEYRVTPAWRIWLKVALGIGSIALLWHIWKPGGAGRA